MATLADIYIAAPETAAGYEENPSAFERIEVKRLTPLELSTLRAILLGKEWNVSDMDAFKLLGNESASEWTFSFPDEFTSALASLGEEKVTDVSGQWAETDELACEAEDVQPIVADLVRLSNQARREGLCLFLWMSL